MDVRCNRCATEYDFDDALISERGTTVRCTNCGFQFKIFPSKAESRAPERWMVRTADHREVVYTSLRELQRGIANREVGPEDLLSRGDQAPRPLGSIAELEPFFSSSASQASTRPARTLHGVAPAAGRGSGSMAAAAATSAPTAPRAAPPTAPIAGEVAVATASREDAATPRARPVRNFTPAGLAPPRPELNRDVSATGSNMSTLRAAAEGTPSARFPVAAPTGAEPRTSSSAFAAAAVAPESRSAPSASAPLGAAPPSTSGRGAMPSSPFGAGPPSAGRAPMPSPPFGAALPSTSGRSVMPSSPFGTAPVSRREFRSYDELSPEDSHEAGRRARSRWIAAVVIAGVTTLFAVTVGRRYLLETAGQASQAVASSNARVAELLAQGNRLMEEGDLEGAAEPLVRATALAEKDRAVLAALARLETLRADVTWLKLRLLDPAVSELVQAANRELGRRVGKARSAADAAFAVAPEDIVVLRARIDTLRLSGEADKAREWIKPIANNPSDPQNAYVLAALDLADANPSWPGIIDRLKLAAGGERVPGRAHAALVYALARDGKLSEAEAVLAKIDASPNAALLVDELKSFLKRFGSIARPAASESSKLGKADAGALDSASATRGALSAPAVGDERAVGDFRKLLSDAAEAVRRGDLSRAESLYNRVLGEQPNNTEALSGLADVARRRNDSGAAARLYDRVLADNPSYLPALMARADQHWDSGNKKAAVGLYHRVLDQSGASTDYGRRAAARIAQAESAADAPAAAASSGSHPAEAAPSAPPASDTPRGDIDTTDLPGSH